jgi:hypothetical protein
MIETINGTIQVSNNHDGRIGVIVERGGQWCGLLLSHEQASEVAAVLTRDPSAPQVRTCCR